MSFLRGGRILIMAVILFAATSALVSSKVNPSPEGATQLTVSFSSDPPDRISQAESYSISILWKNTSKNDVRGSLLFLVSCKDATLAEGDIFFYYMGNRVTPTITGDKLQFLLPNQTFNSKSSDTANVEVYFNAVGKFNWEIGVVKG